MLDNKVVKLRKKIIHLKNNIRLIEESEEYSTINYFPKEENYENLLKRLVQKEIELEKLLNNNLSKKK